MSVQDVSATQDKLAAANVEEARKELAESEIGFSVAVPGSGRVSRNSSEAPFWAAPAGESNLTLNWRAVQRQAPPSIP